MLVLGEMLVSGGRSGRVRLYAGRCFTGRREELRESCLSHSCDGWWSRFDGRGSIIVLGNCSGNREARSGTARADSE